MALHILRRDYMDSLLCLKPVIRWGWHGGTDKIHIDDHIIQAAGFCHVRARRFFFWHKQMRGVIGQVEEPDHLFHGLWIVCAEMQAGDHDLSENLCTRYDLELGTEKPTDDEWPRIEAPKRKYAGYGILAESARHLKALS